MQIITANPIITLGIQEILNNIPADTEKNVIAKPKKTTATIRYDFFVSIFFRTPGLDTR